jgi:hypothetical protein
LGFDAPLRDNVKAGTCDLRDNDDCYACLTQMT